MAKYLDLSAHHEVTLDELLGKKQPEPKPEKKETAEKAPKETEVKKK